MTADRGVRRGSRVIRQGWSREWSGSYFASFTVMVPFIRGWYEQLYAYFPAFSNICFVVYTSPMLLHQNQPPLCLLNTVLSRSSSLVHFTVSPTWISSLSGSKAMSLILTTCV